METAVKGHDGSITISPRKGIIEFKHSGRRIKLTNVLYNPTYSNLISARKHGGYTLHAEDDEPTTISIKGKTIYNVLKKNGKLWIIPDNANIAATNSLKETARVLHEKYGHLGFDRLYTLPELAGIKREQLYCEACEKGKSTKPAARKQWHKGPRTTKILERVHADLIGPITPESRGYKYLLVIIDEHSRYNLAIPLKRKSDAGVRLLETISSLERLTGEKVQQIQADWGGEFQNAETQGELRQRGILTKETVPYQSDTNPFVERVNRAIMTMARTATFGSNMPRSTWSDATQWATYTKNRLPHKTTGKAPIEGLLKRDPLRERQNLRKYGEWVWVHDYTAKGKMQPRAFKARIVNYTNTYGVYWTIDTNGNRKLAKNPGLPYPDDKNDDDDGDEFMLPGDNFTVDEQPPPENPMNNAALGTPFEKNSQPSTTYSKKRHYKTPEEWMAIAGRREGLRSQTSLKGSQDNDNSEEIMVVGQDEDHPTEEQARTGQHAKEWAEARRKERDQLLKYGVYSKIEQMPDGIKPVDTKWVYVIKRKMDGTIEKFKARKVGRGFTQEKGVNYDETYAQMARLETWRVMFVAMMAKGWRFRQWDVVGAYLQADLRHNIYVTDIDEHGNIEFWKLHKALYGLKQAGYEWNQLSKKLLSEAGMAQCISDEGCFIGNNIILPEHVDDIGAFAASESILDELEQSLERHVELELRNGKGLLGMEMVITNTQVMFTQERLIERTVQHFGRIQKKMSLSHDLTDYEAHSDDAPADKTKYRELLGSLLFIARGTRPDIAVAVNLLGRRVESPSYTNFIAAVRVLEYLWATKSIGLRIQKPQSLEVEIQTDASFPGEEARGTTGVVVRIGEQLVHWYTRRQETASLSNSEAE
ncbi:MAG: DDE-type integrase/transposase/recombinase, partial [Gorillibacterium sp.]|nr:DDE-type integrase/transposase/recombinase [Gorillibacterium sp.]